MTETRAPPPPKASFDKLPDETLLRIFSFLEPVDITQLQRAQRHFVHRGRDNLFWKTRCFERSTFLEALDGRPSRPAVTGNPSPEAARPIQPKSAANRARIQANWDPLFPSEKISWYDEYIQRHGPVVVNWMQQPLVRENFISTHVEAKGLALYWPGGSSSYGADGEEVLAVSPLEDGGVCVWDIRGTRTGRRGAILERSQPGILLLAGAFDGKGFRSRQIESGVTEGVSVDSRLHRAFFSVQSRLVEVDLQTLYPVQCSYFPWSIVVLSAASPTVPLTVGTNHEIFLHDRRLRSPYRSSDSEKLDLFDLSARKGLAEPTLQTLFDSQPLAPCASLAQAGPVSILHLEEPGCLADISNDIYVAGRFSSILHYDRRKFETISHTIHSGARLCSMASLPFPVEPLISRSRRKGLLSQDEIDSMKASSGRTLIACGEYGSKGSLELYGISSSGTALPGPSFFVQNRLSASSSKLLSVIQHGSRLAVSDGSGYIKWFERDGLTEIRRCKVGHSVRYETPSLFTSMPGSEEIARKMVSTRADQSQGSINDNNLVFWTGEKLGLVSFSAKPGFMTEDFEDPDVALEDVRKAENDRAFAEMLRRSLIQQADEARIVRNLF